MHIVKVLYSCISTLCSIESCHKYWLNSNYVCLRFKYTKCILQIHVQDNVLLQPKCYFLKSLEL